MLAARRISQLFFEDSIHDGEVEYHRIDDQVIEFDTPADLIAALRADGVEFSATGRADWAAEVDGSHVIDYATGERETVSWHFFPTFPSGTHMVVIAFVDARFKRFDRYPNGGGIRRAIMALPERHMLRDAVARSEAKRA